MSRRSASCRPFVRPSSERDFFIHSHFTFIQHGTRSLVVRRKMMSNHEEEKPLVDHPSRRSFLGLGSAAIATAAFVGLAASAQDKASTQKAEHDHSSSNPGQENRGLLALNPNSNNPPPTDHGDLVPLWYSFDRSASKRAAGHIRSRNANCLLRGISRASICVLPQEATVSCTGIVPMNGPMCFMAMHGSP